MRKALTFLTASLCLGWLVPARAQVAPDMFRDVPEDHWAYEAVEALRSKGILIGYPDGFFRGKRTLTRYEFAVALQRALEQVGTGGGPGVPGPPGPPGPAGPAGPAAPGGGASAEDLAALRRLVDEFRQELANLGTNVNALSARLDRMARDVADLRDELRRMPKISGGAFVGARMDMGSDSYADKDGRHIGTTTWGSLDQSPVVVHELQLGVQARLGEDATLAARLSAQNYLNYLDAGRNDPFGQVRIGTTPNNRPASSVFVDQLEINAPFGALGTGGGVTIGRFHHNISPLTLWKPDTDTYFANPFVDDGMFRMDGLRVTTGFGRMGFTGFAGKFSSVQDTGTNGLGLTGFTINRPRAGVVIPALFTGAVKPHGQSVGQMFLDTIGGVTVRLPVNVMDGANIHASAFQAGNETMGETNATLTVFGAGADLKIGERLSLQGEWSKALPGQGGGVGNLNLQGINFDNGQTNAFTAMVGWNSGGLNVSAGYKYIDPLFYAPGYWGRIGNWINPTNVQGPTVRAAYDFSPSLGITLGGDWFTPARNRDQEAGLGKDDEIGRALVGVRWDVSKSFRTTLDYEGVFWNLNRIAGRPFVVGAAGGAVHPTEHYITLGTGYNLTDTTVLKLGYQYGTFDGHGALSGIVPGFGSRYHYNAFTTQVAVKF